MVTTHEVVAREGCQVTRTFGNRVDWCELPSDHDGTPCRFPPLPDPVPVYRERSAAMSKPVVHARSYATGGLVYVAWPESERWSCDGEYLTMDEAADLIAELQTALGKLHKNKPKPSDMPRKWTYAQPR